MTPDPITLIALEDIRYYCGPHQAHALRVFAHPSVLPEYRAIVAAAHLRGYRIERVCTWQLDASLPMYPAVRIVAVTR